MFSSDEIVILRALEDFMSSVHGVNGMHYDNVIVPCSILKKLITCAGFTHGLLGGTLEGEPKTDPHPHPIPTPPPLLDGGPVDDTEGYEG